MVKQNFSVKDLYSLTSGHGTTLLLRFLWKNSPSWRKTFLGKDPNLQKSLIAMTVEAVIYELQKDYYQ